MLLEWFPLLLVRGAHNVLIPYKKVSSAFSWLLLALLLGRGLVLAESPSLSIAGDDPSSGSQRVSGLGEPVAPLNGPWRFHLGDDAGWASATLDDSTWELLTADKSWGEQGHPSYTGFAWYRLHLTVDATSAPSAQLALLLPQMEDVYEVFWNGQSIAKSGRFPPYPVWYRTSNSPSIYSVPATNAYPASRGQAPVVQGTLAIRVWKAPLLSEDSGLTGGFAGAPVAGYPAALMAYKDTLDYQWLRAHQFAFAEDLVYGIAGMLSLITWLRDRKQRFLLWMTGFTLTPLIRLVLYGLRLHWPVGPTDALGPPLSSLRDISLWFLLLWLLQLGDDERLARWVRRTAVLSLALTVADGALSLVDASVNWFWIIQIADAVLTIAYYLTTITPLVLVAFAVVHRSRLDLARWLLAIAAFLSGMIQVVQGMATQGTRFTHWTLGGRIASSLFTVNGNVISLPTLAGTLLLIASVYAVYSSAAENRRRQTVLQQEMHSARELQRVLIPETLPFVPGFALTSAYRPAQEVGGDFFQIIPLEGELTLVILGDVSGKGIKAAMAVSLIVGLIRVLVETTSQPALLLTQLNRRLHGRLQGGFATCTTLCVDPEGNCLLASAGHLPPYLNHHELDVPGSVPLGVIPDTSYEQQSFRVAVDDYLALYTDGLLEARTRKGELFGFDRLHALLAERPNSAEAAETAVRFGQDDDITVVTLTRVQTGEESSAMVGGLEPEGPLA